MKRILIISALLLAVVLTATADRRRLLVARNASAPSGIAFVASTTNEINGSSVTMTVPAGTVAGGVLLFFCATDSVIDVNSLPSGFALVESNALASAGFAAAYKYTDGTEGSSIIFGFASTELGAGTLLFYSGVNASPFEADAVEEAAPGAGVAHTTAAITPSQNNSMLVGVIYIDPAASQTFTEVSGFPIRAQCYRAGNGSICVADRQQTTATSEGVQIIESAGGSWGEYTLVLK